MKRWVKMVVIWSAMAFGLLLMVLAASQTYLTSRDRAANYAFGEKARQNHIEGMKEGEVRKVFAAPD